MDFSFNVFDPAVKADPYRHYAEMRVAGRLLRNPFFAGQPMVHRYEDVVDVLKDLANFSSALFPNEENRIAVFESPTMLNSDPPDHTRLRGVVARAFTPRAVAGMEPHIRAIAAEMVAPLADREPFDVAERLSSPLPVVVIAEMLGVALEDRDDFTRWSHGIMVAVDVMASEEQLEHGRSSAESLRGYFAEEIARRRKEPTDDLVGRLVEANADGVLSDEELLSSCVLLLLGGNETTTNLITNATLALARHPDQRQRLVAEPSLYPTAIDECLRFDAPVQASGRVAVRDVQVAGEMVEAGTLVFSLLAAANHDPSRFSDPQRLDVGRSPNAHVSFGHGPHFCLGATLARLEARLALEELLRVAPRYELTEADSALEYGPSFFFHSPVRLPIAVS